MPDFHKLSRAALQREMLDRLSEAAELGKESKHHRAELDRIRNRPDALKFEIGLIERELKRAIRKTQRSSPRVNGTKRALGISRFSADQPVTTDVNRITRTVYCASLTVRVPCCTEGSSSPAQSRSSRRFL
jgi:hypothetical protein